MVTCTLNVFVPDIREKEFDVEDGPFYCFQRSIPKEMMPMIGAIMEFDGVTVAEFQVTGHSFVLHPVENRYEFIGVDLHLELDAFHGSPIDLVQLYQSFANNPLWEGV